VHFVGVYLTDVKPCLLLNRQRRSEDCSSSVFGVKEFKNIWGCLTLRVMNLH